MCPSGVHSRFLPISAGGFSLDSHERDAKSGSMSRSSALLWLFAVLIGGFFMPASAAEKKLTLAQHDLEFEIPEGWEEQPPPAGALAYVRSADKTKTAVLVYAAFQRGLVFNAEDFAVGMRKAAKASNGTVLGEGTTTLEPLAFQTLKVGMTPSGPTQTYFCTTFVNNAAFTLALHSDSTDASTDPELNAILASLHFLHRPQPVVSATGLARTSRDARNLMGRHPLPAALLVLLLGAIVVIVAILIRRHRVQPAPPQPPTQQF